MSVINITSQFSLTPDGYYEAEFPGCKGILQIQFPVESREQTQLYLKFPDMLPCHEAYLYGRNILHKVDYPAGLTLILRCPVQPEAASIAIYTSTGSSEEDSGGASSAELALLEQQINTNSKDIADLKSDLEQAKDYNSLQNTPFSIGHTSEFGDFVAPNNSRGLLLFSTGALFFGEEEKSLRSMLSSKADLAGISIAGLRYTPDIYSGILAGRMPDAVGNQVKYAIFGNTIYSVGSRISFEHYELIELGTFIIDAPKDGNQYVRQDGEWVKVN